MLVFTPKNLKTDIGNVLDFIVNVLLKSGVYFLISDFISDDFTHQATLIAKKCDLIAIGLTDPQEIDLPQLPLTQLRDLENNNHNLVDFADAATREGYTFKLVQQVVNQ